LNLTNITGNDFLPVEENKTEPSERLGAHLDKIKGVALVQGHDAKETVLGFRARRAPVKGDLPFSTSLKVTRNTYTTAWNPIFKPIYCRGLYIVQIPSYTC
jgi:hypothetical protein